MVRTDLQNMGDHGGLVKATAPLSIEQREYKRGG